MGKESREELNEQLMKLLGTQDPGALHVIGKLKRMGERNKDAALIGYAYYRYAYYYYFTVQDMHLFRQYVQLAIKHLLRSDDKEFLGGAYNLVAYDAQDLGCYDVAYAYFMMAVQTAEQKEGIALPGLIEASAGRILIELGEYKPGRRQQRNAIRRMRPFTNMHVYHYNMILTYADIALASFLLGDLPGVESARKSICTLYHDAAENEKYLSKTYHLLAGIYHALLTGNDETLEQFFRDLMKHWKSLEWSDLFGVMFEIESLCHYMLSHDYINQVKQILRVTEPISRSNNLSGASRYYTLMVSYCEKVHDLDRLRSSLRSQHEIQKKQNQETVQNIRYSMEFSDMIEAITKERQKAAEENAMLQIRAHTDALTGLPNRNAMNQYLQQKFDEAEKNKTPFGIGIIDVDRFKEYNDTFGHQAGDACLRLIGKALLPFNDDPRMFCARYGGDEFVVGYFGLTSSEIAKIKRQMQTAISKADKADGKIPIRISQGVSSGIPDGSRKMWEYLLSADKKLYRIKKRKEARSG